MQTLKQLNNNELIGSKELTLRENLTTFPEKIFELADTLEFLDLSNNNLSSLPDLKRLTKLKFVFFSYNQFREFPTSFKECHNLYMIGCKANQIEVMDEDILPVNLSWFIITDNKLKSLPNSIGDLTKLKKFSLAGNQLSNLPNTMQKCTSLELLRLSANKLSNIPEWIATLPKLSWIAFSGNNCSFDQKSTPKTASLKELEIQNKIGEGASGHIYKVYSPTLEKDVALKLFKGSLTSDGYAMDEMNIYNSIKTHKNLINIISTIDEDNQLGLLLDLIPSNYKNLGFPPNFDTCTRDTFPHDYTLTSKEIYEISKQVLSVSIHLHEHNITHGDLYAHNILINEDKHCFLGDFGAASFYENENLEKIEVRAFACLIDDLLQYCSTPNDSYFNLLLNTVEICSNEDVKKRPFFKEINLII